MLKGAYCQVVHFFLQFLYLEVHLYCVEYQRIMLSLHFFVPKTQIFFYMRV